MSPLPPVLARFGARYLARHAAARRSCFLGICLIWLLASGFHASGWQQSSKTQSGADGADPVEQQLQAEVHRLETTQATSPDYAEALDKLGRSYLVQRRLAAAEPILERAVVISNQAPGASQELQAAAYVDLGDLYHALHQQQGSEPSWDRLAVLDYFRAAVLLDSSDKLAWADAAVKLATTFRFSEPSKPDSPLVAFLDSLLTRALAIAERADGSESPTGQLAMAQMVRLHRGSKDRIWQNRFCPVTSKADNRWRAQLLLACAASALDAGELAQAAMLARGASDVFEREPEGYAVPERIEALLVLAETNRKLAQVNEAEKAANQALDLCDHYLGTSHWLRSEAFTAKAHILEDLKRKPEAKQARQQAEAIASANKRGTATPRLTNLKLRQRALPIYPADARLNRVEGSIEALCEIGIDGHPHVLVALNKLGYGLDQEALASVSRWHFDPMRKDDQPVPSAATIEVNFKLL
jgi:tetratricopeptide (TPR) repeat protein